MDDPIKFISFRQLEENHDIESSEKKDQSEDKNDTVPTPIATETLAPATESSKKENRCKDNTNDTVPPPIEGEIEEPRATSNEKIPRYTSKVYLNADDTEVPMQQICETEKPEDKTNDEISKLTSKTDMKLDEAEVPMKQICETEKPEDKTNGEISKLTSKMHIKFHEPVVQPLFSTTSETSPDSKIKMLPESPVTITCIPPMVPKRKKRKLHKTVIKITDDPNMNNIRVKPVPDVKSGEETAANSENEGKDPSHRKRTKSRPCLKGMIAIIIVGAAILTSLILAFYITDKKPSLVSVPQALFMQNDLEIWTVDPRNLSCHLLMQQPVEKKLIAFDVYKNKTMLWLERNTTTIKSLLKQNLNVTYPRQWNPRGVALDFVTEKLYVIDEFAEALYVLDVKNNHHGVMLSDLRQPIDIILDPPRGLMFIVQKNHSILRANMDGSSTYEILTNQSVSAITIDRKTRKLYWIEHESNIISSNYDGTNQTTLLQLAYAHVNSLTVYDDQLFCLSSDRVLAHQHSVVLFCKIDSGTCVNLMKHKMPFYSSMIRAPSELVTKVVINPCEKDNGGCEHMCLLKANGGSSCACRTGWQLEGNRGHCEPIDRYILYSQGNYFRGRVLDPTKETFVEAVTPTWFHVGPVEIRARKRETVSFDRGWNGNEVFLNDDHNIYKLNLDDGHQSLVLEVKSTYHIEALAVDRMARNVYYLQVSELSKSHAVKAITWKKNEILTKTVTHVTFDKAAVGLTPDSLVTHPYRSQLFYRINTLTTDLASIYPSTTKPKVYSQLDDSADDGSIAVDAKNGRTYWVDTVSRYGVMIAYATWKDGDVESFDVESTAFSTEPQYRYSLTVHNKTLYVSDFRYLWCIDKNYGENLTRLFPKVGRDAAGIAGVRVVDSWDLEKEKKSECMVDNGGCEQFCFMEETKVCGCQDMYALQSDGRCRYNAIRSAWVSLNETTSGHANV